MKILPFLKAVLCCLATFFILSSYATAQTETIISKEDADRIFGMTLPEWEAYVQLWEFPPEWKVRFYKLDTGTGFAGFDLQAQTGLSIQPLFIDDKSPPEMLIVGSFYPPDISPEFNEAFKNEIEKAAQEDLGPDYIVSARPAEAPPLKGIELVVTKTQ